MTRRHTAKSNRRSRPSVPGEVLAGICGGPMLPPADEPDADLPGCFVEHAQSECDEFWREWRRLQRVAAGRVPVLLLRRRRSRLLMVIAAEDLFAVLAAVRAVEDRQP